MRRSPLLELSLGLLAACSPKDPGDLTTIQGRCAAKAPKPADIGDGIAKHTGEFAWTYDAARQISISPMLQVALPKTVSGLAVTISQPGAVTAFVWATLDDRVLIDISGAKSFGDAARMTRADTSFDTSYFDTYLDTAYDTGPSDTALPIGPGEKGDWGRPPFYLMPSRGTTLALPVNDADPEHGGCLSLRAAAQGDQSARAGTLGVLVREHASTKPRLDIDLVIDRTLRVDQGALTAAFTHAGDLLAHSQSYQFGQIMTHTAKLGTGGYVKDDEAAIAALHTTDLDRVSPTSLPVFLIHDLLGEPGTLGMAGGLPGAIALPGAEGSGLLVAYDSHLDGGKLDANLLGETLAHELGHLIGLLHTTEAGGGSFDGISDTPECQAKAFDKDHDGAVSQDECLDRDGTNLMFWVSGDTPQTMLSPRQAAVLSRSPVMR